MTDKTKLCRKCNTEKSLRSFTNDKSTWDGKHSICRVCRSEYVNTQQKLKRQTDTSYRYKLRKTYLKGKKKRVEYVANYKIEQGCKDCGVTYPGEPWLLEFDHLHSKSFDISTGVRSARPQSEIDTEIAKCDVLCLICHRRRTAKRGKYGVAITEVN